MLPLLQRLPRCSRVCWQCGSRTQIRPPWWTWRSKIEKLDASLLLVLQVDRALGLVARAVLPRMPGIMEVLFSSANGRFAWHESEGLRMSLWDHYKNGPIYRFIQRVADWCYQLIFGRKQG